MGSLPQDDIHQLRPHVAEMETSLHKISSVVESSSSNIPGCPSSPTIQPFSDIMTCWSKLPIKDQFVFYHKNRGLERYKHELDSPKFKMRSKGEKERRIKSNYERLKKVVKTMLHFCDAHPQLFHVKRQPWRHGMVSSHC